jgi:hypothetical protein
MAPSISEQCRSCALMLDKISSAAADQRDSARRVNPEQAKDQLDRLSLWMGNIGALHSPESSLSVESRLSDEAEILDRIKELLNDLAEVAGERTIPSCSTRIKAY